MNRSNLLSPEEIQVLEQIKQLLGRTWKSKVRAAWFDGLYDKYGLGPYAYHLQVIRNEIGPSALKVKLRGNL